MKPIKANAPSLNNLVERAILTRHAIHLYEKDLALLYKIHALPHTHKKRRAKLRKEREKTSEQLKRCIAALKYIGALKKN